MKPQKQTILHDPDNGKFGNCFSAVLASLLHIDINEIPVFKEKETWKKEVNKFLRPYNLAFFDFMDYPEAAEFGGVVGLYHEQAGNTVRGKECSHATVAIDGKVVFDPHPNGDGLAEVYDYSGVFVCLEPWQLIEAKREIESLRQQLAACKAALSEPETVTLPKIDYDADMDRYYIPMPAGWEMQTKGKSSSFRLCNTKTHERVHVLDERLQPVLEQMAREMHEASKQVSLPDGWVSVEKELPSKPCFAYYKNELGNSRIVKAKYVNNLAKKPILMMIGLNITKQMILTITLLGGMK